MKRAALVAGVSVVALAAVGMAQAIAAPNATDAFWGPRSRIEAPGEASRTAKPPKDKSEKSSERSDKHEGRKASDKTPALPAGPLQIVVSIDKQRATLFAGGVQVAESKISSGTPGHPTPMGVFTVIQKDRHHVSNLYDAPMPYMQRITWSGSALHEGPLPGRPASHGCVRLTSEFAQLLWKTTKIGARVIITRDDVAPVAIESERLFLLRPKVSQAEPAARAAQAQAVSPQAAPAPEPVQARQLAAPIKTADAANTVPAAVVPDTTRPFVSKVAANVLSEEPPAKLTIHHDGVMDGAPDPVVTFSRRILSPAPAAPPSTTAAAIPAAATAAPPAATPAAPVATPVTASIAAPIVVPSRAIAAEERPRTAPRPASNKPVSVFVSLKEHKLYVRQGWQSVLQTPVTIEHPERPIGTHVYTAIGPKADGTGMRWTVVTIPSSTKRATDDSAKKDARKSRQERAEKQVETALASNASAALERIDIPPDVVERISAMIIPGSSLIVSDNKLSDETGDTTDFIVLTP